MVCLGPGLHGSHLRKADVGVGLALQGDLRALEAPTLNQTIKTNSRIQLSMTASPYVRIFNIFCHYGVKFIFLNMSNCSLISSYLKHLGFISD